MIQLLILQQPRRHFLDDLFSSLKECVAFNTSNKFYQALIANNFFYWFDNKLIFDKTQITNQLFYWLKYMFVTIDSCPLIGNFKYEGKSE